MPAQIPTEEEVLSYFDTLSNWGRWGEDDQHGTLNFLTQEKTKQAVSLVQEGTTVSCSRTVTWTPEADHMSTPLHFMLESGEGWASGDKVTNRPSQASTDFFGMAFDGYHITPPGSTSPLFFLGGEVKASHRRPQHTHGQPCPLLLAGQNVQRSPDTSRLHRLGSYRRVNRAGW